MFLLRWNVSCGGPIALLAILAGGLPAAPAVWHVGSDPEYSYATIQQAADTAADGDEIVVHEGTYEESISIGKSLVIRSAQGAAATVIHGKAGAPVVSIAGPVEVTLSGFTISGGTHPEGAGIRVAGATSATIEGNEITGNGVVERAVGIGGGILARDSRKLAISGNTIRANDAWIGAGVAIERCEGYVLRGNTIADNGLENGNFGSGVFARDRSPGTIEANVFRGNWSGAFGGAMSLWTSATIMNNLITGNHAYHGAGIYLYRDEVLVQEPAPHYEPVPQEFLVLHNTVADNTGVVNGAGIDVDCDGGSVVVQGTIVWGNKLRDRSSNLQIGIGLSPLPMVIVAWCDVEDPDPSFWDPRSEGNIALSPQFVAPEQGDYDIDPSSPCVDAAPPHPLIPTDLDGDPRDAAPDIGADEIVREPPAPPFVRGDVTADGRFDLGDPIFLLQYLFSGGATPTCLDAANIDGEDTLLLTDPIYLLNFLFANGPPPAPPCPTCGRDADPDALGCESFPACE